MTQILNKTIERIKKGCGKKFNEMIEHNTQKLWQCGGQKEMFNENKEYCPTCQAKLSQAQEDADKFDKFIESLKEDIELNWKHYQYNYNPSGSLNRKEELLNKINKLAREMLE